MSSSWLYLLILIAGVLQAWGPPMNNALRNALINPWLASLISFLDEWTYEIRKRKRKPKRKKRAKP